MKDATLAQGNGVLNLILQKRISSERLQDLIESGILADVLDAKVVEIDRLVLKRALGLKPVIRIYFDPNGSIEGSAGCYRACLRENPRMHGAGKTVNEAREDLRLTLRNFDQSDRGEDYEIIDETSK